MSNKLKLSLVGSNKKDPFKKHQDQFREDILKAVNKLQTGVFKEENDIDASGNALVNSIVDGVAFFSSSFLEITKSDELKLEGKVGVTKEKFYLSVERADDNK